MKYRVNIYRKISKLKSRVFQSRTMHWTQWCRSVKASRRLRRITKIDHLNIYIDFCFSISNEQLLYKVLIPRNNMGLMTPFLSFKKKIFVLCI